MSGHIIDMVNRIRQNTISKRKKFQGDNRAMMFAGNTKQSTSYEFPTLPEAELDNLKTAIRNAAKENARRSLYVLIVCIGIAALILLAALKV